MTLGDRCTSGVSLCRPDCRRLDSRSFMLTEVSLELATTGPVRRTRLRNVKMAISAPPICSNIIVLTLARRTSRCWPAKPNVNSQPLWRFCDSAPFCKRPGLVRIWTQCLGLFQASLISLPRKNIPQKSETQHSDAHYVASCLPIPKVKAVEYWTQLNRERTSASLWSN